MKSPEVLELDVRPFFDQQRPPLPAILAAVNQLAPGQPLRLIAPFEPKPLYELLAGRGYQGAAQERPDGAWAITFTPTP